MTKQTLTYNTPNSEHILRKINQYEFKRQWKNNLKNNNRNLYWGITFIVFGIIAILLEEYIFSGFFFGFSLASISSYYSYQSRYKKYKKTFYEKLDHEISSLELNSKDVIWEFTPTHFSFKNYKSEFKFLWSEITYCILDDEYLYITASSFMNFILDKANIDKENLNETLQFLENKSKFIEI